MDTCNRTCRALALLENKLVDFVGSDAHRIHHRDPKVKKGIEYLYGHFDEKYVDDILYHNVVNRILK